MRVAHTLPDDTRDRRPGPYAALAARARRASDGGLVAAAALGAAWLALLVALHPRWWQFVVAPVAVGAFGLWGIADRELAEAPAPRRRMLLRAVCVVAVVVGTLAVVLSAFRVLGAFLGTVVS